jgi:hypothetical protein
MALDPETTDPDIAFALIMSHEVEGLIYEEGPKVKHLFGGIYQIEHTGSDDDLSIGASIVQHIFQGHDLEVWETTQVNPWKYVTTVMGPE